MFQELDYQVTPIGALSLRRRHDLRLGFDVYEIKLGDAFLMSSAFTASEVALARLGLAAAHGDSLDVVVGGLGLGYTAATALETRAVRSLLVIEMLPPVIEWHRTGLLPLGSALADPRCRLIEGDFFAMAAGDTGFDPNVPAGAPAAPTIDCILLDIDHTPDQFLDEASRPFYTPGGLTRLARHLKPGGIFALWSNDPPDPAFTDRLSSVFAEAWAEPVRFDNPLLGVEETQTVYLARAAG